MVVRHILGVFLIVAATGFADAAEQERNDDSQVKPAQAAGVTSPSDRIGQINAETGEEEEVETEGPSRLEDRARWFHSRRLGPDGRIPENARNRALQEIQANIANKTLRAGPVGMNIVGDGW